MEQSNIDTIKQMIADGVLKQEDAEKYFPELKESEDERIRKVLIDFITDWKNGSGEQYFRTELVEDILAWLEKKGEQNTTGWNKVDKCIYESIINDAVERNMALTPTQKDWVKSLKCRCIPQQQEWSEEDDRKIRFLIHLIENNIPYGPFSFGDGCVYGSVTKPEAIGMLKSLRHLNHWKPSEEQMEALWAEAEKCLEDDNMAVREIRGEVLESLYNDLKKL